MRNVIILLLLISPRLFGQRTLDYKMNETCHIGIHLYSSDSAQRIEILNHRTGEKIKTLTTNEVSYFENPVVFSFDQERFIRVNEVVKGTGYFNTEHLFNVGQNCHLTIVEVIEESQIHLKNLPDSVGIFKGEYRKYNDNEITFYYGLWKKDDPNCCPSIGYIIGTYKIVKHNSKGEIWYSMEAAEKRFSRDPN